MRKEIEQIVSRETMDKYDFYYTFISKWNRKTALVQIKTLDDFWSRHLCDSFQLSSYLEKTDRILDVGSGGGFPGMVLAMNGFKNISLCESNIKKTIFLEELARETQTSVVIIGDRVENILLDYDVVISRACAKIDALLNLVSQNVSRETFKFCLFLKGRLFQEELDEALKKWVFKYELINSLTSKEGVIIKLWNIKRR